MKGIAPQPDAHGFKRQDLGRGNIAQVHIAAQQFDKIKLLCFLRCFPDNLLPRMVKKFVALDPSLLQNSQVVEVIAQYKRRK